MLKKLLTYFSLALVVQLGTGVLTKVVEMLVIGDALTEAQYGEYRHFLLILELGSGIFFYGFDQALVTFIGKGKKNYPLFVRFFLSYALLLGLVSAVAGFLTSRLYGFSTTLAVAAIGLFVVAEIGKLIFRARMEKAWELGLLALQSLTWSVGCAVTVLLWDRPEVVVEGQAWLPSSVPIWWHFAGIVFVATIVLSVMGYRMAKEGSGYFEFRPRGERYVELWRDYRPLWLAGFAFVVNVKVIELMVDVQLGREAFGQYGFVMGMMLFIQRPLSLVQRAALPLFTRHPDEVPHGFRQMVRLNVCIFPLIAIGLLGFYDLVLQYGTLSKYAETWPLLALVLVATPTFVVEYLIATAATARGFAQNNKRANIVALIINIPLASLIVWLFGLWGAAIAAMIYPFLFGALILSFNRRDLPEFVRFAAINIIRSTFWLALAIGLLAQSDDYLWWAPVAGVLYIVGVCATGLFPVGPFRKKV